MVERACAARYPTPHTFKERESLGLCARLLRRQLRFVLALTAPGRAGDEFAAALCEVIRSACGHTLDARADGELPLCASKSFGVCDSVQHTVSI